MHSITAFHGTERLDIQVNGDWSGDALVTICETDGYQNHKAFRSDKYNASMLLTGRITPIVPHRHGMLSPADLCWVIAVCVQNRMQTLAIAAAQRLGVFGGVS